VAVSGAGVLAKLYLTGLSVAAWIKPVNGGGGNGGRIVDKDNNDQGWYFDMSGATALKFAADQFTTTAAQRTSTATIAANTWVHVVATWDGLQSANATFPGGVHIFISGVQADSTTYVNGSGTYYDDSTTPFTIGNRAASMAWSMKYVFTIAFSPPRRFRRLRIQRHPVFQLH
jgi:Concanavalin A-like lectin/glucanases superfamily